MRCLQNLIVRLTAHSPRTKQSDRKRGPSLSPKRLLITAFLAMTVTACNSPKEGLSYPAPDNICGMPADKVVLESLLDNGDKLEQDTGYFSLTEGQFCHMYVDGNDSVVSEARWHEKGYEVRDLFQDYNVKGLRYLEGGTYASWNRGVATVISCPAVSNKGDVVSVEVRDMNWNQNSQALLEKLIPDYFEAYKKKLGCGS